MKQALIFFALIVLVGCQQQDYQEPCGGYGCHYTATTELGIRYRSDAPMNESANVAKLDTLYKESTACMGVWYDPDFMLLINSEFPAQYFGLYLPTQDDLLLLVRPMLNLDAQEGIIKHEYIHYLLDKSTGDPDSGHNSPLFALCSGRAG